jgi:DNA-binding transcriptional MerR regulator
MTDYRIDDLAQAAGTNTRNVRAYQDRGLLPPPRRSGRIGLYDDGHLARLRLIASMLTRGYNTAQIAELITAWEQSKDITDVLGVEQAVTNPWSEESPLTIDTAALRQLLGDPDLYERLVGLELITAHSSKAEASVIVSPQLVNVFLELVSFGFTPGQAVALHERVAPVIDQLAREMVGGAAELLIAEHGSAWVPEGDELGPFTETLHRMRALAMASLQVNFARAMDKTVDDVLAQHIQRVITATATAENASGGAA